MTKKASIFLLFFALTFSLFAQQPEGKIKRSDCAHHAGITGGYSIGYGLSYLYQPNKSGFQLTYSPYYTNYRAFSNLSFTYAYTLRESRNINLMLYVAEGLTLIQNTPDYYSSKRNEMRFVTGCGLEYQFYLSQKFKLNIHSGFAFQIKNYEQEIYDTNLTTRNVQAYFFSPDGGVSLFFMF